jgi:hypothetical protein
MRSQIRAKIEANLVKNANKKRILTKIEPWQVLNAKFESAAKAKKEQEKAKERSQQNRRRKERLAEHYLRVKAEANAAEKNTKNDFLDDMPTMPKIKLPYRLQMAIDQLEAEKQFENSDFGRLMRGETRTRQDN